MGKQQVINSFCVACGSRNVVQHSSKAKNADPHERLVRCRACGVVSVDFNERTRPEGVRHGFEPLNKSNAIRKRIHNKRGMHIHQALVCARHGRSSVGSVYKRDDTQADAGSLGYL